MMSLNGALDSLQTMLNAGDVDMLSTRAAPRAVLERARAHLDSEGLMMLSLVAEDLPRWLARGLDTTLTGLASFESAYGTTPNSHGPVVPSKLNGTVAADEQGNLSRFTSLPRFGPNKTDRIAYNWPTLIIVDESGNQFYQQQFDPNATTLLTTGELGLLSFLPLQSDPNSANSIGAWFSAGPSAEPIATHAFPDELQIFLRDPEETASFFEAFATPSESTPDTTDVTQIRENLSSIVIPPALSLLSPAAPTCPPHLCLQTTGPKGGGGERLDPTAINVGPQPCDAVVPNTSCTWPNKLFEFELFADTVGGIAAEPTGTGSIKALKMQRPGWCTNEVFYNDIILPSPPSDPGSPPTTNLVTGGLNLIDFINSQLQASLCPQVRELLVHNATIVPLMRRTPHGGAKAQLFFNANLHLQAYALHQGCNAVGSALWDLGIDANGRLRFTLADGPDPDLISGPLVTGGFESSIEPTPGRWNVRAYSGGGCGDITWPVYERGGANDVAMLLSWFFPLVMTRAGLEAQSFPPSSIRGSSTFSSEAPQWQACSPSDGAYMPNWAEFLGDRFVTRGPDICADARNDVCNLIRLGFIKKGGFSPNGGSVDQRQNLDHGGFPLGKWNGLTGGTGCAAPNTPSPNSDELLLQRLFAAINATSTNWHAPASDAPLLDLASFQTPYLRYWSCEQTDTTMTNSDWTDPQFANTSSGQCLFTPPIKRIIANPDGIQAVLFEQDPAGPTPEWDNAALAAWYAVQGLWAWNPQVSNAPNTMTMMGFMQTTLQDQYQLTDPTPLLCTYKRGGHTSASVTAGLPSKAAAIDPGDWFEPPSRQSIPMYFRPFTNSGTTLDLVMCPRVLWPCGAADTFNQGCPDTMTFEGEVVPVQCQALPSYLAKSWYGTTPDQLPPFCIGV